MTMQSESNVISEEVVVRTENLHKYFGKLEVLRGISTTIKRGEVIAVIGPSGCGKSTFLRCINRLETPEKGKIWVDGVEVTSPNTDICKIRQKMGMVFQLFHLFPHMTVLQNLTYAPINTQGVKKTEAENTGIELLKRVGLEDKAFIYPSKLSGGQKQRVAIARALAMKPDIMLFDEPTSALDPEMVREVLDVIQNLAETGITMAIVTHEMNFARKVADRILFLHEGQIAVDATPEIFFSNPGHERAQRFLEKML